VRKDVPVRITKLSAEGAVAATYSGVLLAQDDRTVVARCTWSQPQGLDLGDLVIESGDIFTEFYYRDRWCNVFRIENAAGNLKGWYCNVTQPPQIEDIAGECHIRWQDCALDLLVLPDGSHRLLDEDEFEALGPSADLRTQAAGAVTTLLAWLAAGSGPFQSPAGTSEQVAPPHGARVDASGRAS